MFPWAVPLIVSGFIRGWIFNSSYGVLNHLLVISGSVANNVNFLGQATTAMMAVIVADIFTTMRHITLPLAKAPSTGH